MSKRIKIAAAFIAVSLWPAANALAQEFQGYEGKNAIREGEGGTKKTVDGVDFWSDGAPPYRFKLIGFINDRRHKTGLIGMVSMSGLESSVAEVAKKNGGDAVIQMSSEAETVGVIASNSGSAQGTATTNGNTTNARATGWSTGAASAVQKQNSKFAVVKYMKEAGESVAADKPAPRPETTQTVAEPPKQ